MTEWYPEQLKLFAEIAEKLNEIDRLCEEATGEGKGFPGQTPYFAGDIKLTDSDCSDLGIFSDQVGGAWSWSPSEVS